MASLFVSNSFSDLCHAEEIIHSLEAHAFGLWDEEPDEEEHREAKGAEDL